VRPVNQDEDI